MDGVAEGGGDRGDAGFAHAPGWGVPVAAADEVDLCNLGRSVDAGELVAVEVVLLDAARLEKDRTPAEAEDVDLAALLANAAAVVCQRYQRPADVVQLDLTPCIVHAAPVEIDTPARSSAITIDSPSAPGNAALIVPPMRVRSSP